MDTTNYLTPGPGFWVGLLVMLVLFVALVVWPLVQVVREGRVGWALAVVFLAPLGGLAWFIAKGSLNRSLRGGMSRA